MRWARLGDGKAVQSGHHIGKYLEQHFHAQKMQWAIGQKNCFLEL